MMGKILYFLRKQVYFIGKQFNHFLNKNQLLKESNFSCFNNRLLLIGKQTGIHKTVKLQYLVNMAAKQRKHPTFIIRSICTNHEISTCKNCQQHICNAR